MNVLAIFVALLALSNLGTYFYACHSKSAAWEIRLKAEQAERYRQVTNWVLEASDRSEKIALALNKKTDTIKMQVRTITKEIPIYVPTNAGAPFGPFTPIPFGLVRLHDAAATGAPLPESPPEPPFSPSPITAIDGVATITENYETCRIAIEQVNGWIAWYEQERAKWNSPLPSR